MGDISTPKKEDLKVVGFKPGVGTVYVDPKNGKKYIERRRLSVEQNAKRSRNGFRDAEGHKIHMSKKDRQRLKAQYDEYMRQSKAKEAGNGDKAEKQD